VHRLTPPRGLYRAQWVEGSSQPGTGGIDSEGSDAGSMDGVGARVSYQPGG